MTAECPGTRADYTRGHRCEQCKRAEAEYRKQLRSRQRGEIGLIAGSGTPGLSLVTSFTHNALASGNAFTHLANTATAPANSPDVVAGGVEAGVQAEIEALGSHRPGLAAAELARARIMDNPTATSSQPAAARQLVAILGMLSKCAQRRGSWRPSSPSPPGASGPISA